MNSTTGTTCWISIRGMLLKCSKEQVRKASNEESIGTELVKQIIGETREALESKTQRGFRDISSEETPPDSTWVPDEGEAQATPGEDAGTVWTIPQL